MENAYSFAFHHGSLYYISRETDPLIELKLLNVLSYDPECKLQSMDAVLKYPYGEFVYIQTKLADTEDS